MNRPSCSLGILQREEFAAMGPVELLACRRRIASAKTELCVDQA